MVLGEVWGLQWPGQLPQVLRQVADLVVLPAQIEDPITAHVEDPRVDADLALAYLSAWDAALSATASLTNVLQAMTQHLSEASMFGLQMASSTLSRVAPEPPASAEDPTELAEAVAALLADVLGADLDEELRAFLLEQLRAIQDALARVRLRGAAALHDAVDQVVGASVWRRRSTVERLREEQPDWSQRFWTVVGRMSVLVSVVSGPVAVANNLHSLLTLPPAHAAAATAAPTSSTALTIPAPSTKASPEAPTAAAAP